MLTGKHVILRAVEREDLKPLHKWQNDGEVMELARSQPDLVKSMASLETELEKTLKGDDTEVRRYMPTLTNAIQRRAQRCTGLPILNCLSLSLPGWVTSAFTS